MLISVIIPTHNNCAVLSKTLANFCELSIKSGLEWELIIVNNNCTDDTIRVVNSYSDRLPIKLFHEERKGISFAKNRGIDSSSGDIIIFTDDDVRPEVYWVEAYMRGYDKNPSGYFFGGPVISEYESNPLDEKLQPYAPPSVIGLDYGNIEKVLEENNYFIGANMAVPRQALDDVGHFDVNMGLVAEERKIKVGEETDLMDRLRKKSYQALYMPEARIYHYVPAAKTTLHHIAARKEAHEYCLALQEFTETGVERLPKYLVKQIIKEWFSWRVKRFIGKEAYAEYIQYRVTAGKIRAAIDCANR